jgi:hypothetical protein
LGYWLALIQNIRPDAAGTYNFALTPTHGLSDYETGRIEYHRGAFRKAATLFEPAIRIPGESQNRLSWLGLTYMSSRKSRIACPCFAGESTSSMSPDSMGHVLAAGDRRSPKDRISLRPRPIRSRVLDRYDPENRLYRWLLNFN